jgi:prephenate dehydrogenase
LERLGTVAIVGVGLIGGSIGLAVRARGLAERVIGIGRNEIRLAEGVRHGAIDSATTCLADGVKAADVVVVCTPVTQIADDVRNAARSAPKSVLITDAGSTKALIVESIEGDDRALEAFVGGHPIAGSERKGVAHAEADLFQGRVCVLTPTSRTPEDRLRRARRFWQELGCRVIEASPDRHDQALALTSHLPHVVAAALASAVPVEVLPMAAGAYRDGTRVAASDASLWAGIFLENREYVLEALQEFQDRLDTLKKALGDSDHHAIRTWWDGGKVNRSRYDALNET